MKPEQRVDLDETRRLAMPRQGVSLLNDMFRLVKTLNKTHPPNQTVNNINRLTQPAHQYLRTTLTRLVMARKANG